MKYRVQRMITLMFWRGRYVSLRSHLKMRLSKGRGSVEFKNTNIQRMIFTLSCRHSRRTARSTLKSSLEINWTVIKEYSLDFHLKLKIYKQKSNKSIRIEGQLKSICSQFCWRNCHSFEKRFQLRFH